MRIARSSSETPVRSGVQDALVGGDVAGDAEQVEDQGHAVGPPAGVLSGDSELTAAEPAAPQQDAAFHARMTDLSTRYDFNEYAASVKIYAIKE